MPGYRLDMSTSRPEAMKGIRRFDQGTKLDKIDKMLMAELAVDARLPNNALADRVGIAQSTCSMRLQRLRDVGAIRGYHADLSLEALGHPIQAMIAVRLQPNARANIGGYACRLAKLPGVLNVYWLAGSVDFLIQVATESPDALRQFVTGHLSEPQEFTTTETTLVFDHVRGDLQVS